MRPLEVGGGDGRRRAPRALQAGDRHLGEASEGVRASLPAPLGAVGSPSPESSVRDEVPYALARTRTRARARRWARMRARATRLLRRGQGQGLRGPASGGLSLSFIDAGSCTSLVPTRVHSTAAHALRRRGGQPESLVVVDALPLWRDGDPPQSPAREVRRARRRGEEAVVQQVGGDHHAEAPCPPCSGSPTFEVVPQELSTDSQNSRTPAAAACVVGVAELRAVEARRVIRAAGAQVEDHEKPAVARPRNDTTSDIGRYTPSAPSRGSPSR